MLNMQSPLGKNYNNVEEDNLNAEIADLNDPEYENFDRYEKLIAKRLSENELFLDNDDSNNDSNTSNSSSQHSSDKSDNDEQKASNNSKSIMSEEYIMSEGYNKPSLTRRPINPNIKPNISNVDSDTAEGLNSNNRKFQYTKYFLLFLFFFLVSIFIKATSKDDIKIEIIPKELELKEWLEQMKEIIPNQPWAYLKSSIGSILNADPPRDPAVLMLIVPRGNSIVIDCMYKYIDKFIRKIFNTDQPSIFIDATAYQDKNKDDIRLLFDDSIQRGFSHNSKMLAIDHLEKLPFESAMVLHHYCDNDYAPYKKVLMLFFIHIDILESEISNAELTIRDFTRRVWGNEFNKDQIEPLITRIAPLVAIIKKEENFSSNKC